MTALPAQRAPEHAPTRGWLAVLAVTLGIFALMTSELLPVGLLTPVGGDLGVSPGTAGLMVTVPGLVAAVSAPLVTVATGRFDRRLVLAVLVGVVGAANLVSAAATDFAVVLAARFLIGVGVGGFWSLAGGIALRLVPPHHVARATALIFGGVETASVLGVPLGTLLGDHGGWRMAFAAVGVLGLISLVCMVLLMPAVPPLRVLRLGDLPRVVRGGGAVRAGLVLAALVITGHFTAYTFLRPVLQDDGVDGGLVGVLLLVFGAAGICGNFVAGALVAGRLRATVAGIAVVLTAAMAAVALVDTTPWTAAALLVLWGLGYGAVPVTLQTWTLRAAPDAPEAASSLYVSVFNLSIALGALLGGFAVDGPGPSSVLWAGALLTLTALLMALRTPAPARG
ncbi:MFS transporter [Actinocorallia sp. API 0066]|uniref:MFS transporter n=1 Tax=Actinocorallia sp. API 0066 TaxID=2896846 RepID=UPI001E2BA9AB|nr:MFS transporter [Actinocorallia sp. API 0066]MCD0449697.1 MFS transporter [Actinocorallia sp. API 0066]